MEKARKPSFLRASLVWMGTRLVAKGTPEEVSKTVGSHTGYYLKKVLKRKKE
jgi:hypothetical protein